VIVISDNITTFVDVLSQETMHTIRLIKVFRNQRIYSDGDIER